MKRIFQIEWAKIAPYGFVRVMLILLVALFFLVIFVTSRIEVSVPGFSWRNIYRFPNNWESFSWVASWFNILLAIIIITVTGNELQHRTFRQQVMSGLKRSEWLIGKGILIVILAFLGVIMVMLSGFVFGFAYTREITFGLIFKGSAVVLIYFVQAVGYMILGLLFVSLFRSNALSIIMFLLYFIFIEPIIRLMCPQEFRVWFPVKIVSHLTPAPEILQLTSQGGGVDSGNLSFESIGLIGKQLPQAVNLILALGYIFIFSLLVWQLIRKRDL
jgi:ABC-type transport system involved in multi-copper enzyme maturation permease subunit